jgi:hypothetical protein
MARLSVHCGDTTRIVPLAGSSLVGRGAACLVRMDDPAVPTHWLELRWIEGGWRWRTLAAAARTRGVAAANATPPATALATAIPSRSPERIAGGRNPSGARAARASAVP